MGSLITLDKKEVEFVTKRFAADATLTYSPRKLTTVEECADQYRKAPEIAGIAHQAIKDGLQGSALLKAKKLICGDEWNAPKLTNNISKKWKGFLETLNLLDKKGSQKMNVSYLLDFAGYKEVEAKLIEEGEDIIPIGTASHFRETKKHSEHKDHLDVAIEYTDAVHANNDVVPKTAEEVKEVVLKAENKVSSEAVFMDEFPQYQDIPQGVSDMKYGLDLMKLLPDPDKKAWKSFYHTVARCLHPDTGGSVDDMAILTRLNEMYSFVHNQSEIKQRKDEKMDHYKIWCKDHECEVFDWIFIEDTH